MTKVIVAFCNFANARKSIVLKQQIIKLHNDLICSIKLRFKETKTSPLIKEAKILYDYFAVEIGIAFLLHRRYRNTCKTSAHRCEHFNRILYPRQETLAMLQLERSETEQSGSRESRLRCLSVRVYIYIHTYIHTHAHK
jgi:hypothetical protein